MGDNGGQICLGNLWEQLANSSVDIVKRFGDRISLDSLSGRVVLDALSIPLGIFARVDSAKTPNPVIRIAKPLAT